MTDRDPVQDPDAFEDDDAAANPPSVLWILVLAVVLGSAGVVAWQLGPMLEPPPALTAPVNASCDIKAGPCTDTFLDGTRVRFEIRPTGIPLVTPLELDVRVEGVEPSAVQVDFAGYDMDMGFNRTSLRPSGEPGHFTGTGMLPICVRDRMTWEAKVLLETSRGLLAAPFRFVTFRSRDVPESR